MLMWVFVFVVVYSLRADLFGVRVRKMPEPAAAAATPAPAVAKPGSPSAPTEAVRPVAPPAPSGGNATTSTVSRIVITSGPKTGLELPLGTEPLTIGRSSESGLVIRDDYTSSHHARLVLWGEQWMLQDLGSTNGTWHDGTRVSTPVPVLSGAPIKVGATTFELRK
ncbi:antibiotic biosynthesis regulator FhaB [Microbacterium fluvii]